MHCVITFLLHLVSAYLVRYLMYVILHALLPVCAHIFVLLLLRCLMYAQCYYIMRWLLCVFTDDRPDAKLFALTTELGA